MFTKIKTVAISLTTCALLATSASAEDLIINFDDLNPGPKKGFEDAVAAFKAAKPDINVTVNLNDR